MKNHFLGKDLYELALKSYKGKFVDILDMETDLNRIKKIKRQAERFLESGEINHRMLINHVIILSNVFGILPTMRLILKHCNAELYPMIVPVFVHLRFINDINSHYLRKIDCIELNNVVYDNNMIDILRKENSL